MALGPFLTELDTVRLNLKGSVDPLGAQQIWTHFGRRIVANLTTVANSARDFGVLLMGVWLAEKVDAKAAAAGVRDDLSLKTFLKWESLVAFSRVKREPRTSLRGIERVRRRLGESQSQTISDQRPDQILSNQKTYGLYGLFTVPARRSGLLEESGFRLTGYGRDFVEKVYVERLERELPRGTSQIVDLLAKPSFQLYLDGKHAELVAALGKVFANKLGKDERAFFRDCLLYGVRAPDAVVQKDAAQLMLGTVEESEFELTQRSLGKLAKEADRRYGETDLGGRLREIGTCEAVLAPAGMLFSFLLGRDGDSLAEVAKDVPKAWRSGLPATVDPQGFQGLRLPGVVPDKQARLWGDLAQALHAGEWVVVLELLLRLNATVMAERSGAPWAELENGKLKVLRHDEGVVLGDIAVPNIWRNPYFLLSLRQVAVDVGGPS